MGRTGPDADRRVMLDAAGYMAGEQPRVVGRFNTSSGMGGAQLLNMMMFVNIMRLVVCSDESVYVFAARNFTGRLKSLLSVYPISDTSVEVEQTKLYGANLHVGFEELFPMSGASNDAERIKNFCDSRRYIKTYDEGATIPCPSCGRTYMPGQRSCGWCNHAFR